MHVRPLMSALIGTTALTFVLAVHTPAHAQVPSKDAQIVVDVQTNEVLYEHNAQAARIPASITKVMTLYLLFDALKKGEITWDDRIVFSRNAANQPPTKLFVGAGNSISVQTAVEALVLRSANDVATAVAERLGGSESNFAQMMTSKARELGMSSTTFRNASGLPNASQRTTAEDLARLAIAIHRDFPEQYHWFSAQQMSWNGQTITGHNHLMGRVAGMDGLKTGYTNASGFNLAATTQRGGRRVVTVVLGGSNRFQRDDRVEVLTESAFRSLGIGATQFAYNASAYEVNFRDARDAADAAALFMDLPPRPVTMGGLTTVAMTRSGRRIGFDRGPPVFQVADMTRRTDASRVISGRGAQLAQREDTDTGPTDQEEVEVATLNRAAITGPSGVTPIPVPFRVAVAPSALSTPSRALPTPTPANVPSSVPVVFANAIPPARAVPAVPAAQTQQVVPLRQMAQIDEPRAVVTPTPPLAPAVSQAETTNVAPVLRGSVEATQLPLTAPAAASAASVTPEASPPQAQPTQMAELLLPQQPVQDRQEPRQVATNEAAETPEAGAGEEVNEVVEVAQAASTTQVPPSPAEPAQMAELAREDAAALASSPASAAPSQELNGSINLASATPTQTAQNEVPVKSEAEPADQAGQAIPTQMAVLASDAVAQAQQRQAEANAREQTRMAQAQAIEDTRREAARVQAAAAARVLAERRANERRAERLLAENRARELREKEARDLALAARLAAQERAVAAQAEERRQAEATRERNARGTAVVQVGAFKDRKDANAAIARFSRYFPSFAQTEVTTVSRRDGVWYRARFAGVGASAAGEACRAVLGRGGVCEIVGR